MTAPAAAIQLDRVYAGINHYNAKENRCSWNFGIPQSVTTSVTARSETFPYTR